MTAQKRIALSRPGLARSSSGSVQATTMVAVAVLSLVTLPAVGLLGEAIRSNLTEQTHAAAVDPPHVGGNSSAAVFGLRHVADMFRPIHGELDPNVPTTLAPAIRSAPEQPLRSIEDALDNVRASGSPTTNRTGEFLEATEDLAVDANAPELNRGLVGTLRKLFRADPAARAHMKAVADDPGLTHIEGAPESFMRRRIPMLSFVNHAQRRRLAIQAMKDEITQRSDQLWSAVSKSDTPFYDRIVIGSGPLGAHAQGVLDVGNPGPTTLAIDSSSGFGSSNFGAVGDAIRYNQSNRAGEFGEDGRFIFEARNRAWIAPGYVSGADLSFNKWAPARDLADLSIINSISSASDHLNRATLKGIKRAKEGAPGKYLLLVERDGKTQSVFTNQAFIGTGLKKELFPGLDKTSLELIDSERAKLDPDDPTVVPLIMSGFDELQMAGTHPSWWENAYAFNKRKPGKIAFIGSGDTTFTLLEQLARTLGAPELSNFQRANRGGGVSKGVEVYGGFDQPSSFREFLLGDSTWDGIRSRYAGIISNVVRAFTNRDQLRGNGSETTVLRPERVKKIRRTDDGRVEITSSREGGPDLVEVFDRAVFSTGVEADINSLLADFIDPKSYEGAVQKSGKMDVIDANRNVIPESDVGLDDRAVARQVPGEDIYAFGVAAGQDIISDAETVGNVQNRVSIALWAERTRRLLLNRHFGRSSRQAPPTRTKPTQITLSMLDEAEETMTAIPMRDIKPLSRRAVIDLGLEFYPDLALKYELARSFHERFRLAGDDGETLVINFVTVERGGQPELVLRTNFESGPWEKWLREDGRLLGVMRELSKNGEPQTLIASSYTADAAKYGYEKGQLRPESITYLPQAIPGL